MKKLLILLTTIISSVGFSQDINLKPFDKSEFDTERINQLYDTFSLWTDKDSKNFSQDVKNIYDYGNNNFSWINDSDLKTKRQKEYIVKQIYSMMAVVALQNMEADTEEEANYILLQFKKGSESEKPIWDEIHKKVWVLLM